MAHDVFWLKPERLLFVRYKGHQTVETLTACLDAMAAEFDRVRAPAIVLIDWRPVEKMDFKALITVRGHRAFSHPMAARGVLVGMDVQTRFENEISVTTTRGDKNTHYCDTMVQALETLKDVLGVKDIDATLDQLAWPPPDES